ncbi:GGDEF domain-containing protein [Vibrio maerlii]|uniref:GGDEF domain-containing protein n=1 Tax=Vibrio maerlii TaxID=2231648 RepID=UPI000E3E1BFD|nr:GGDEF domain-containing protein [Vibrio maerlii]
MFKKLSIVFLLLISLVCRASDTVLAEKAGKQHYDIAITADDFVAKILFDSVSEEFGVDVTYYSYPTFGDVLDAIESGDADFAPNATYTGERAKTLYFSEPTNIEYTYIFSEAGVELEKVGSVAVPINTVFGQLLQNQYPDLILHYFDETEDAKSWIEQDEVDAIVAPINYLTTFISLGLQAKVVNDRLGIKPVAIVTGSDEHQVLLERVVEFIHSPKMQRKLHRSISNYQLELRQASLRNELAKSSIELDEKVDVKFETVNPYVIYGENGELSGIAVDVLLEACDILSVQCNVLSKENESWTLMLQELLNENIDIIGPMSISESRRKRVHFSRSFFSPEIILVKRLGYKDNVYHHVSELLAERIGVIDDDFAIEKLSYSLPQKEFLGYPNQNALISALLSNEVEYIAMDRLTLNRLLRDRTSLLIGEAKAIGGFYSAELAFAFPHNQRGEELAALFSKAINIVNVRSIIEQYDIQPQWRNLYKAEHDYSVKFSMIFILFALCAAGALYSLHQQSITDQLTGLKNRRALSRRANQNLPYGIKVLYLDVNSFKQINDTYGHDFGDRVLKHVAIAIKHHWEGQAYRIGGDEFVLVGRLTAEQTQSAIEELSEIPVKDNLGNTIQVSLSIGFAEGLSEGELFRDILKHADENMYERKRGIL